MAEGFFQSEASRVKVSFHSLLKNFENFTLERACIRNSRVTENDDFIARISHSYFSLAINPRRRRVVPMSVRQREDEQSTSRAAAEEMHLHIIATSTAT